MSDLFFNPQGRLRSADFLWAGFVLILIGTAFQILALMNFELAQKINWLSYGLIYPWVVIWIKRLHEGGKSGWMFPLYILLYFLLSTLGFFLVNTLFGNGEFWPLVLDISQQQIPDADVEVRLIAWVKSIQLPSTIVSILVRLLVLYIGDWTIGIDPDDNQWGAGHISPSDFD